MPRLEVRMVGDSAVVVVDTETGEARVLLASDRDSVYIFKNEKDALEFAEGAGEQA